MAERVLYSLEVPGMWVYAHHSVESIASSVTGSGSGRTRALLRLHYAGPLSRLLGRLTRDITNRYLAMEAAGLKQRSEQLAAARA